MAHSVTSNSIKTESWKRRPKADEKPKSKKLSWGVPLKARRSPYVAPVEEPKLKRRDGEAGSGPPPISTMSSWNATKPRTNTVTCEAGTKKAACTFIESVINLCSKSLASCGVNRAEEFIFQNLIRLCGVEEAQFWCRMFGFKYEQSYAALSALFYGRKRPTRA